MINIFNITWRNIDTVIKTIESHITAEVDFGEICRGSTCSLQRIETDLNIIQNYTHGKKILEVVKGDYGNIALKAKDNNECLILLNPGDKLYEDIARKELILVHIDRFSDHVSYVATKIKEVA